MKREDLMSLADRCEKAQGADRLLDFDIAQMIGLVPIGAVQMRYAIDPGLFTTTGGDATAVPRYTASLDAALSLVPEGWAWAVYGGAREEIVATAYCVPNGGRLPWPDWVTDICAATPALALCAAALRALASGAPR